MSFHQVENVETHSKYSVAWKQPQNKEKKNNMKIATMN